MPSDKISHYRITGELGRGGMGVVHRAHDETLGRDVALKVLPAEAVADGSAKSRLIQEARTASVLNHPNICTIYEVGEAEGQVFVSMELVDGKPLAKLITTDGLGADAVARYGAQIADALAHAHERGVIHRDLKPANIIITPAGRAKVLDFGLARRLEQGGLDEATRSQPSSEPVGVTAGTLAYMAPEQLRGEPADARSDIWALGMVLYEMAAGQRPFQGRTGFDLSSAILRGPLAPLPSHIPPGLRAVIQHCLMKEPGERYQRASEVRAALEAIATDTVERAAMPPRAPSAQKVFASRAMFLVGGALLAFALLLGITQSSWRDKLWPRAQKTARIESIAVLPLANLSGDPSQEYFADGVTEALITEMAQISSLRVISRTSVMQYKGARKPLPEIARELNVDAVVEGSVQRAEGRVGITVQLIRAADDRHLLARSYERDLRDVLSLQREVARTIAAEIQLKLTPQDEARLAPARPVNPEAHEAYLRGLYAWNKFTIEGFQQARDSFQEAIRKDPGYASAYVGLADAYVQLAGRLFPPAELMPKAKQAALKALELNPNLGEGHSSLAYVLHYYEWNWAEAEKEYKRALELNPGYSRVHTVYAFYLVSRGRFDESLAEMKRGQELDPLALNWKCGEARLLYYARRYDQAIDLHRQITQLDSRVGATCYSLIPAYLRKGMTAQAISLAEASVSRLPGENLPIAWLGHAYAVAGRKQEAMDILHKLLARSKERYVSPYELAVLHAGLGDKDRALEWLEGAVQARTGLLVYLNVEPAFDPLRADLRFQALLRRINFPQ